MNLKIENVYLQYLLYGLSIAKFVLCPYSQRRHVQYVKKKKEINGVIRYQAILAQQLPQKNRYGWVVLFQNLIIKINCLIWT